MSDWTPSQIKEFLLAIMAEREKRVAQLEHDAAEALEKAQFSLERRLDLLNDLREEIHKRDETFVTKSEFSGLRKRVNELTRTVDEAAGRWKGAPLLLNVVTILVAIAAVVVAVVAH